MKKVVVIPKSVEEFNSWSVSKRNKFIKEMDWNLEDVAENIRLNNLDINGWLDELGY